MLDRVLPTVLIASPIPRPRVDYLSINSYITLPMIGSHRTVAPEPNLTLGSQHHLGFNVLIHTMLFMQSWMLSGIKIHQSVLTYAHCT